MAGSDLEHSSLEAAVAASRVDRIDEPSVGWGWHGEATRFYRFLGWFFTAFLLLMLIGNHEGKIEDLYLVGFAALLVFILVRDIVRRRRTWSR